METKSREERIADIYKLLDKPRQDYLASNGGQIYGQQEAAFAENRGIGGYIVFAREDIEEEAIKFANSYAAYANTTRTQWICQFSNIKMKYVEILFRHGAMIDMQQLLSCWIGVFEHNSDFLDLLFKYQNNNIKNFHNHVSELYTVFSDMNIIRKIHNFITEKGIQINDINRARICKTPEILEFLIENYKGQAIIQTYSPGWRVPYLDKLEFIKVIVKYPILIRQYFEHDIGENEECQILIVETMYKNKINIPVRCITSFKVIMHLDKLGYNITYIPKYADLKLYIQNPNVFIEEEMKKAIFDCNLDNVKDLLIPNTNRLLYIPLLRHFEDEFKELFKQCQEQKTDNYEIIFYNRLLQRLLLHAVLQHKHAFLKELLKIDFKWDLNCLHEKRPIGKIKCKGTGGAINAIPYDKKLSLLHYALLDKDYEIGRILVEAGIDINIKIEDRDITFYLDGTIGKCTPKQTIDRLLYPVDERQLETLKKQISDLQTENLHLRDRISSLEAQNENLTKTLYVVSQQLSVRPIVITP